MNALRTLTHLVAGISLAACASTGQQQGIKGLTAEEEPRATVEVENHNWSDVDVFAVEGGIRYRLGTVVSMSTVRLRLPRGVGRPGRDVRLVADPIGSPEVFTSQSLQVSPGQMLSMTLQNHLAISSVAVFNR
ncbi:MAG TPA: hypothetical protein VFE05_20635 [Longimicrobiaceae bacterium]|jgi:hypothetical protein|nr:hypothetical protein [Longimicrobiaceae bacterium]